jgi:hypothetical protein
MWPSESALQVVLNVEVVPVRRLHRPRPRPAAGRYDPRVDREAIGTSLSVQAADAARLVEEGRVALRFVIHLVGDLHQPLHVGDNGDRGGNDTRVRWFARGSNMHRVWDSGIIERASRVEDAWLADLNVMDTPEARAKAMMGSVEDWATESLLAARGAYQDPATGMRIRPGARLADAYQDAHLPTVRRRIYQAGMRLAMVLNGVWPEE